MKDEKNVLLITYYWPPSGGAGVHRWLRFSQFFKENGCNLTVYCPINAAWPIIDEELEKGVSSDITVIRNKIIEPQRVLGKKKGAGTGFTREKKLSVLNKLIVWVRGNLFVPDSRVLWIKPSTRFLKKYLAEHSEIDTVISTGPPHSMHLIALNLQRELNIKWIADFRDPWTQIDFYKELMPSKFADRKQKDLERKVLREANEVVTVSESCADGLKEIINRKVHVITNGYVFPEFNEHEIKLDADFTICYFGSMPFGRNPKALWEAIASIISENEAFENKIKIKLVGTVDFAVLASAEENGVRSKIELVPPIPHKESIELQKSAQLLLLVGNNTGNVKGILTGKFFEYLGAKRPILAIGQSGSDLAKAVNHTNAGYFADFNDAIGLKKFLEQSFILFQNKSLSHEAKNIEIYNSKNLAANYVDLIRKTDNS